ncbi:Helix-turn-helix [Asanoa hainanensis]|uniref:Helix-turn-helix n=1 Tax=Asanoa hainanensis TaxID=560556 RepID=A0A239MZT9_9ACTN|nr:helix-turn-helix transcriptional regulator [Asanoa hainanensis]SNT48287.1 Helix-turn-helix [Asanoa hainanensis]
MPDTGVGPVVPADRAHELRAQIRDLIRKARRDRGLSQAQLGSALGQNRYRIIRLEKGELDVTVDEADELDRILNLTELAGLVRRLHKAAGNTESLRDTVVSSLLRETPTLTSVSIVVADDLDVFSMIYDAGRDAMRLDAREIKIVFPSADREQQLYGGNPLWGYYEYQIKHLVDLQGGEAGPAGNLQVYESDRVTGCAVVASTHTGTQSILWPAVQTKGGIHGAWVPAMITDSNVTNEQMKAHIDYLLEDIEPLRTNEALCRFDSGSTDAKFTRYFAVGTDEEDDVAGDEGIAVSLVMAIALCPRKHYGVGNRVIMYKRPSSRHDHGLLSLFSNNVDDTDIRTARALERGNEPDRMRSTRSALAATLDINDYLTANDGVIPELASQLAAARELKMFGLDVTNTRLKRVPLPPELRLIRKPGSDGTNRAAVVPSLFVLTLETSGPEPELDVLSNAADSEAVGIEDIAEFAAQGRLNTFLVTALESGFLTELMQRLEVAKR